MNHPCSKSVSPEMAWCIPHCHFVLFFSQSYLCFVAISSSFCHSVLCHPFFLHPLGYIFYTSAFSSPIVLQKKGKSHVEKGSFTPQRRWHESPLDHVALQHWILSYRPKARGLSWVSLIKYTCNNIGQMLQGLTDICADPESSG